MNKYPTVIKVVGTPDNVEVVMENVIPEDPSFRKIPLTVSVVPHDGKLYLSFSGMSGTNVEVQTLADLFQQEILVHTVESKLERKLNEISDEQLKWHLEHGEFLKQIRRKLLGKYTND